VQKESKIKELQSRVNREMQLLEESKSHFDDSVKKFTNFNPNSMEIMRIKKDSEKQQVENKHLTIELEAVNKQVSELQNINQEHERNLRELTDLTTSMRNDGK